VDPQYDISQKRVPSCLQTDNTCPLTVWLSLPHLLPDKSYLITYAVSWFI